MAPFRSIALALATAAVVLMLCPEAAWACPTCKDAVANGNPNLVQGYFWSIIFMMSMPFLILGGMSLYFYLLVRSARLRAAREEAELAAGGS